MNRTEYTKKLQSLGCAYSFSIPIQPADLEQTIIDGLSFYWTSNDLFFMLYSILNHRIGHLVHVERLVILSKKSDLKNDELILLLCLSKKLYKAGYKNFKTVITKLGQKKLRLLNPPKSETDSFLIERWGLDPEFKEFGVEVRTLPLENKKKFFILEKIFKINPWLALRAVVGTNNRADILYVKTHNITPTANQASKHLSCSIDAAYRYWRASVGIDALKINIKTLKSSST